MFSLWNNFFYAHAGDMYIGQVCAHIRIAFIGANDDGAGFDVAQLTQAGGLTQLAERIAAVGGALTVHTRAGGGTRVAGRAPTRVKVRTT